jgi:hypothetical protein
MQTKTSLPSLQIVTILAHVQKWQEVKNSNVLLSKGKNTNTATKYATQTTDISHKIAGKSLTSVRRTTSHS